jgi:hypothetical protein
MRSPVLMCCNRAIPPSDVTGTRLMDDASWATEEVREELFSHKFTILAYIISTCHRET